MEYFTIVLFIIIIFLKAYHSYLQVNIFRKWNKLIYYARIVSNKKNEDFCKLIEL